MEVFFDPPCKLKLNTGKPTHNPFLGHMKNESFEIVKTISIFFIFHLTLEAACIGGLPVQWFRLLWNDERLSRIVSKIFVKRNTLRGVMHLRRTLANGLRAIPTTRRRTFECLVALQRISMKTVKPGERSGRDRLGPARRKKRNVLRFRVAYQIATGVRWNT